MTLLTTPDALRALYEPVRGRSAAKELPALDVHATRFIGLSPFVVVATGGASMTGAGSGGGGGGGTSEVSDAVSTGWVGFGVVLCSIGLASLARP